jgi:hypothetical protein
MKKAVRKTGDYGIGIMIHSVHMTDDVRAGPITIGPARYGRAPRLTVHALLAK